MWMAQSEWASAGPFAGVAGLPPVKEDVSPVPAVVSSPQAVGSRSGGVAQVVNGNFQKSTQARTIRPSHVACNSAGVLSLVWLQALSSLLIQDDFISDPSLIPQRPFFQKMSLCTF